MICVKLFCKGYYTNRTVDSAPPNKASDLNTAAAWLISGNTNQVPNNLKSIIEECRTAITENEIDQIELLYVHNLPESVTVSKELVTATEHLSKSLPKLSERYLLQIQILVHFVF